LVKKARRPVGIGHHEIEHLGVLGEPLAGLESLARDEIARSERVLTRVLDRERKLFDMHYAGRISDALFDEESHRLRKERAASEQQIETLGVDFRGLIANVELAVELASDLGSAYQRSGPTVRRLILQAFFEQLRVRSDDSVDAILSEPIRRVLSADLAERLDWGPLNDRTPDLVLVGGSSSDQMVELGGLEPPTSWVRSRRSPN
jgi:hypothetical protein